jgi:hypothetical protein
MEWKFSFWFLDLKFCAKVVEPQNLVDPMQEITPCYISTSSIETWYKGLSPVEWNYEVEADFSPARLPTALGDKSNVTMSSGYIQPAIVYPASKESTSPTKTDMADTMSIRQDEDIPSIDGTRKGKKPRKSRKKPRSKEDEELKRNLSLERNRQPLPCLLLTPSIRISWFPQDSPTLSSTKSATESLCL